MVDPTWLRSRNNSPFAPLDEDCETQPLCEPQPLAGERERRLPTIPNLHVSSVCSRDTITRLSMFHKCVEPHPNATPREQVFPLLHQVDSGLLQQI